MLFPVKNQTVDRYFDAHKIVAMTCMVALCIVKVGLLSRLNRTGPLYTTNNFIEHYRVRINH